MGQSSDEAIAEFRKKVAECKTSMRMDETGPAAGTPSPGYTELQRAKARLSQLLVAKNRKLVRQPAKPLGAGEQEDMKATLRELGISDDVVFGEAVRFTEEYQVEAVADLQAREGFELELFGEQTSKVTLHEGDHVELRVEGGVVKVIEHRNGLDAVT